MIHLFYDIYLPYFSTLTTRGGRKGGPRNRKTAQIKLQKPQYRIELYQNTETAVTNVGAVLSSILEVHHSITNMTLCIPITAKPPPRFAPQRFFALYPYESLFTG